MYELAVMEEPPLRVVIGSDAFKVCLFAAFLLMAKVLILWVTGYNGQNRSVREELQEIRKTLELDGCG